MGIHLCEKLITKGFTYEHPHNWGRDTFNRVYDLIHDHKTIAEDIEYLTKKRIGIVYSIDKYRDWIYFINYDRRSISYVPVKTRQGEELIYSDNIPNTKSLAYLAGIYTDLYGEYPLKVREID